ncbi:hypothetical protein MN608_03681 [Microdochium nivale]|nr:hypothetical protein MN608_03681 [Microdochium nivale]
MGTFNKVPFNDNNKNDDDDDDDGQDNIVAVIDSARPAFATANRVLSSAKQHESESVLHRPPPVWEPLGAMISILARRAGPCNYTLRRASCQAIKTLGLASQASRGDLNKK